jgi:hypothetical protein
MIKKFEDDHELSQSDLKCLLTELLKPVPSPHQLENCLPNVEFPRFSEKIPYPRISRKEDFDLFFGDYRISVACSSYGLDAGITLSFTTEKKFGHGVFYNQHKDLIDLLLFLSRPLIYSLVFSKRKDRFSFSDAGVNRSSTEISYYDSKAYVDPWFPGLSVSSLFAQYNSNDKSCQVRFHFIPKCYMYFDEKIVLRPDWSEKIRHF